jgi:ferredoxin
MTGSAARVVVDDSRCEGHGQCAVRAPTVYALDDDGVVQVLAHDDVETARLGARACPVAALTVVEP